MSFSTALTTLVGVLGLANLVLTTRWRDAGERASPEPPPTAAGPENLPAAGVAPESRS
ncbi:hypothetical protein [Catenulispora yoronensis]